MTCFGEKRRRRGHHLSGLHKILQPGSWWGAQLCQAPSTSVTHRPERHPGVGGCLSEHGNKAFSEIQHVPRPLPRHFHMHVLMMGYTLRNSPKYKV